MYLSNLAAIVKHQSDSLIVPQKGDKHSYQSNRTYILNRIKRNIVLLLRSSLRVCHEALLRIIEESARVLSIIRPGRKYGRYKKHTRRKYYNHMKSCI